MGFFSKKRKVSAGLSIQNGSYRYLAIEGDDGTYNVVNKSTELIPARNMKSDDPFQDSGAYLDLVFRFISSRIGHFDTPVNFAIPISESLLRIVNMPGMTEQEARMAFRYEFENYFPFSEAEGVYDVSEIKFPVREDVEEPRFIVAAARRALIENISRSAVTNGIRIASLEPAQIALERAASPEPYIDDGCVYLYAGVDRSVLILSWKGAGIFYRSISVAFGTTDTAEQESDEYKDLVFSFVRDVRSSLQFALSQNRGFSAKSIYLFGPGAAPYICSALAESVSLEHVIQIDPMKIHGVEMNGGGEWDIALGLALR